MSTKKSMDDILDEALDDLDDESSDDDEGQTSNSTNTPSAASAVPVTTPQKSSTNTGAGTTSAQQQQQQPPNDEDINLKEMEDAMKSLFNNMGGDVTSSSSNSNAASADLQESISKILSGMQSMPSGEADNNDYDDNIPDMDDAQTPQMGEDIMEQMMHEFAKMGGADGGMNNNNNFNSIVDGMMKQLLAKDLMYEPMKSVCDKFPEWLAEAKEKKLLSEEDYNRYGHQYQYFQRIVAVYETDPNNFPRLLELMQDIQEYGQPPAEIIKELAPGLGFDGEGMPMMPGLGSGGEPQCPTM